MFTLLGITATFAAGPLVDYLPALRVIGGVVLIVLGLDLAGLLHVPGLAADVAAARRRCGRLARGRDGLDRARQRERRRRASATGSGAGSSSSRGGWLASFGLGAIFAVGWSPCIGIILGGILTMAATSGTVLQGTVLLVAYTLGLGLPFLAHRRGVRPGAAADARRSSATVGRCR